MTDDTTKLLKKAAKDGFSIAGYVSTAATFFPIGNVARTYVIWVVLVLIIVGVFRSAQALTAEKNKEIAEATKEKDRQVEELRTQKDSEIAELNARIVQPEFPSWMSPVQSRSPAHGPGSLVWRDTPASSPGVTGQPHWLVCSRKRPGHALVAINSIEITVQ